MAIEHGGWSMKYKGYTISQSGNTIFKHFLVYTENKVLLTITLTRTEAKRFIDDREARICRPAKGKA